MQTLLLPSMHCPAQRAALCKISYLFCSSNTVVSLLLAGGGALLPAALCCQLISSCSSEALFPAAFCF